MSWAWIVGALAGLGAFAAALFKAHSAGVRKGTAETLQVAIKSRQVEAARDTELREAIERTENEAQARRVEAPAVPSEAELEALHQEVKDL